MDSYLHMLCVAYSWITPDSYDYLCSNNTKIWHAVLSKTVTYSPSPLPVFFKFCKMRPYCIIITTYNETKQTVPSVRDLSSCKQSQSCYRSILLQDWGLSTWFLNDHCLDQNNQHPQATTLTHVHPSGSRYTWLWSMLTINLPVSYLCSRGSYSRWGCARTKPRHIPVKTWLPLTIGPHRAVINDNTADRPCQTLSTQAFTRAMVHLVGFIFVFVSRTMSEAQRQ